MTAPRRHLSLVPPAPESGVVIKRRPKDPEADLYSPACDTIEGDCHRECRHRLPTHRCTLIVAQDGERTLEEVALHFGLTRERCRQIEEKALRKLRGLAVKNPKVAELLGRLLKEHVND